jgi:CBS domain-containing protein
MSRRDEHLDALLKHLGATYYQTLHGGAAAWDVNRAVAKVEAAEAVGTVAGPEPPTGEERRTGRWRVGDVMQTAPVTVNERATAKEIARLMSERRVGVVPVISRQGRLLGVISEGDLLRSREHHRAARSWFSRKTRRDAGETAAELMTAPAITIDAGAALATAARQMTQHHIWLLPVVTPEGDLLGVVSRRNLLSIFLRPDDDIADEVRAILCDLLLIDEARVIVTANDGTVTLDGQVAGDDIRDAAIRVASEVDGVAHVIDKLSAVAAAGQPGAHA